MNFQERLALHISWLKECQFYFNRFNEWEQTFLQSIEEKLDEGNQLSDKQAEILERLYYKC